MDRLISLEFDADFEYEATSGGILVPIRLGHGDRSQAYQTMAKKVDVSILVAGEGFEFGCGGLQCSERAQDTIPVRPPR
jgi:hypothetical protein